ncbi:MAG: DUF3575 domain-containing protein [Prevotella sp.]|nr:DUF3575 domain-containing protein [Prevotella sp.]
MNLIENIKICLMVALLTVSLAGTAMAQSTSAEDTGQKGVSVYDSESYGKDKSDKPKPNRIALKTNLLYDAVLVPNVGIEVNLGKRWTVGLDWLYTWFKNDSRHRYWQGYGGYLGVRKYFGKQANGQRSTVNGQRSTVNGQRSTVNGQCSPFPTGHHLGVYMTGVTYDVEWGGKGYQAAKFGFGGGIEYGYSKRIGKRLDLDFSLGVGFQDGEYKEYEPADDDSGHYVWLATKKRHWWGPTKAEVTLKWILGPARKKKGGRK